MSGILQPPIRLWRIEHETRRVGPFNIEVTGRSPLGRMADWYNREVELGQWRPAPHEMPTLWLDRTLRLCADDWDGRGRFAFISPAQIRKWFCGHAVRRLGEQGWVLRTLMVPWWAHARYENQATYDSGEARVLETLPLDAVFWLP